MTLNDSRLNLRAMKKRVFATLIFPLTLAIFFPRLVDGAEKAASALPALKEEEVKEQMKLTLGRSALPEGIDPEKLDYLLSRGEMVIIDEMIEEIPWLISAGIPVNASLPEVWKVIIDFEGNDDWVPACKSVVVTNRGDNTFDLDFTLGFKFIFLPLNVRYSVRHYNQPPFRTDWVGLGGDIEQTYGWFQNIPVGEKERTLFFYTVWSLPGSGLLRSMYEKYPFIDVGIGMSAAVLYTRMLKDRVKLLKGQGELAGDPEVKPSSSPLNREEELRIMQLLSAKGPVIQFEEMEEGRMGLSSWITIGAPRSKVFEEITDYLSYQYFMPMVKGIEILEMKDERALVEFKHDVKFIVFSARPKYVLEYRFLKPEKITWTAIKGDKYVVNGSWELFPIAGGEKTLACYRSTYDVSTLGFLVRAIMRVIPEGQLAVNSYVTQKTIRDIRDWIEATSDMKERLKTIKNKIRREKQWDIWADELRKERMKRR
jgi:ribosome-associated toxin RatA of RatAB toxin-antitoxin module